MTEECKKLGCFRETIAVCEHCGGLFVEENHFHKEPFKVLRKNCIGPEHRFLRS